MTEHFLQYIWFHKLFMPNQMCTDGRSLQVLSVGNKNYDEGPDAFNAKLKINGIIWVGNVEIHLKSSDWYKHSHHKNHTYDSVILHVVAENDVEIKDKNGHYIPTFKLNISDTTRTLYENIIHNKTDVSCSDKLRYVDDFNKCIAVERMAIERMNIKARRVAEIVNSCNGNLEKAFFVLLCRNFGFSVNSDAMQMLAMSFPHNTIFKIGNKPMQIEALFLGQSGFLNIEAKDEYTAEVQREYKHLKAKYGLKSLPTGVFKMLRLRPYNFPVIRLSQLANLMAREAQLYAKVVNEESIDELRKLFFTSASKYWNNHFTLSSEISEERIKSISKASIDIIIINTVIPFLFYCADIWNDESFSYRAMKVLESINAEKNVVTRLFSELGFKCNNALDSQGIIQCYREYCQKNNCLRCPLCYHILSQDIKNKIQNDDVL